MGEKVPSQDESTICHFKALYLGTSIFNSNSKRVDETRLRLSVFQDSIAERYPVNGSNQVKGIQTSLKIYPSGIQMEHSSVNDDKSVSALFYYPMRSLVYCGALRFLSNISNHMNTDNVKFAPIDEEIAKLEENQKNPPLFVLLLKSMDSDTGKQVIECHVFVVGTTKTAMKLVESCQKAFSTSKIEVADFYKKYRNCPVVYTMSSSGDTQSSVSVAQSVKNLAANVKIPDGTGFFYGTDQSPIDLWQLFDVTNVSSDSKSMLSSSNRLVSSKNNSSYSVSSASSNSAYNKKQSRRSNQTNLEDLYTEMLNLNEQNDQYMNPYDKTDNLLKVEQRIDPVTGQKVFIRYLVSDEDGGGSNHLLRKPSSRSSKMKGANPKASGGSISPVDLLNIYGDKIDLDRSMDKNQPLYIRHEKTPSPIIVEQYVKKKAPQVIIKEIHVQEPAPPPIKVIQKMPNYLFEQKEKETTTPDILKKSTSTSFGAGAISSSVSTANTANQRYTPPSSIYQRGLMDGQYLDKLLNSGKSKLKHPGMPPVVDCQRSKAKFKSTKNNSSPMMNAILNRNSSQQPGNELDVYDKHNPFVDFPQRRQQHHRHDQYENQNFQFENFDSMPSQDNVRAGQYEQIVYNDPRGNQFNRIRLSSNEFVDIPAESNVILDDARAHRRSRRNKKVDMIPTYDYEYQMSNGYPEAQSRHHRHHNYHETSMEQQFSHPHQQQHHHHHRSSKKRQSDIIGETEPIYEFRRANRGNMNSYIGDEINTHAASLISSGKMRPGGVGSDFFQSNMGQLEGYNKADMIKRGGVSSRGRGGEQTSSHRRRYY